MLTHLVQKKTILLTIAALVAVTFAAYVGLLDMGGSVDSPEVPSPAAADSIVEDIADEQPVQVVQDPVNYLEERATHQVGQDDVSSHSMPEQVESAHANSGEESKGNLGFQFIRAFGSYNSRFENMIDGLIADEGVDEAWSAASSTTIHESLSEHFQLPSEYEAASECLETVCYVDLNLNLPSNEVISKWRGFQEKWTGGTTLSNTTVLYKKEDQLYRLYFFKRGFQVPSG